MCVGDCRQVVFSASFTSVNLEMTLLKRAEAQDTCFLVNLKYLVAFLLSAENF